MSTHMPDSYAMCKNDSETLAKAVVYGYPSAMIVVPASSAACWHDFTLIGLHAAQADHHPCQCHTLFKMYSHFCDDALMILLDAKLQ
jgi:hypothetical protein